jgi:hypothetical protein
LFDFDSHGSKEVDRILDAVFDAVDDFTDVSEIDESFCAPDAGEMSNEDDFLHGPRGVAINDGVFLAMQTAAVSRFISITAIR